MPIAVADHVRGPNLGISLDRYFPIDTTTTIAAGVSNVPIAFPLADSTSANVSAVDTNNKGFVIEKTGIWIVEFTLRVTFSVSPTIGDFFAAAFLVNDGGLRICGETISSPITVAFAPLLSPFTVRQMNAGDIVQAQITNSTNQTLTLASVQDICHFSFTWLQSI